jgi:phenylalanyl-tRNA synthetase beta chain
MPTLKYNKNTILDLIGKKISDEQLANRISFLGTGFEGINADEIEVEIFPNRPDLLSEQGMARALSTFMDVKSGFKKYDVKKSGIKVIIDKSVKGIRPYTACAIVKGLRLTDEKIKEIIQIQEKLHVTYGRNRKKAAIGVYPLEHIKPPIFYKALHPEEIKFKPLDLNKDLTGSQILAIHPTGREYGYLLEGKEKYPIFIDSKQNIMSMPPIINSNTIGKIMLTTKDVFIECSGFDFDYLHTCLNIIVTALADMGGQIYTVDLQYPEKKHTTPDLSGKEMKLDPGYVNKILGLELKESDLKKYLGRMGHDYKNKKVRVPSYRADILHPIDLVEDITIAYGYENFRGTLSEFSATAHEKPLEKFKNALREILLGTGFIEVKNYHLTNKDSQSKLMNYTIDAVELENSVTQEYNVLRAWITPSIMETLRNNKHYDYPQNIFEIGTVFKIDESQIGLA